MICKEWKFFLHLFISIILLVLVIINIFIQNTQTNEYKDFSNSVYKNRNYYEYLLMDNNYYIIKEDESKKIIDDFITLENKEDLSFIIRILYTMIAFYMKLFLYVVLNYITKKILEKKLAKYVV